MPAVSYQRRVISAALTSVILWGVARPVPAQQADTISRRTVAPGVTYSRFVRLGGPWIVNVLTVDLRRPDLTLRHARAHDQLRTRERTSDMARRPQNPGDVVLAAVNADFFDLKTGENENNQVIDGEWWKGVKVTESPFGTFHNVHAQFGLDSANRPLIDRFVFEGSARTARAKFTLISLNGVVTGPEGTALFTYRAGANVPRDTIRPVTEAPLRFAARRGDTTVYVRQGPVRTVSGGEIPAQGAVLVGYGATAKDIAGVGEGETVYVSLRAAPLPLQTPLAQLAGGWPRILRDGVNIAANSATEEGTIARNAMARHPRTVVGFSRDSSTLYLVTVDGRSTKSVGMTTVELADLLLDIGAWQALNFDGGGSTAMWVQGTVVNSPTDPTGEREVGNALLLVQTRPRSPRVKR